MAHNPRRNLYAPLYRVSSSRGENLSRGIIIEHIPLVVNLCGFFHLAKSVPLWYSGDHSPNRATSNSQEVRRMNAYPNPDDIFPNEYHTSCYIKNVVTAPHIPIGDYS